MRELTDAILTEEYQDKERSFKDIAEEFGTYPMKLRRRAIKLGLTIRDKSKAQAAALKTGRSTHPTAGGHSEEAKLKISEGVGSNWDNMSEDEKERRRNITRTQWAKMSPDERMAIRTSATPGLLKASKDGSKLENYVKDRLTNAGYFIEYHRKGLIPNANLEVDIYLPELATAIEIDGPAHFQPIWGEDALRRTMRLDNEKNGLLRYHGIVVLRVAQKKKTTSQRCMRKVWNVIEKELIAIRKQRPSKDNLYKEIEV